MDISQQVIPLPMAKRLKELGIEQNSHFHHLHLPKMIYRKESWVIADPGFMASATDPGESFAAFTCSEVGVMLPCKRFVYPSGKVVEHECYKYGDERFCAQIDDGVYESPKFVYSTEAKAKCALLIHLLESNLITAAEVNERLKNA